MDTAPVVVGASFILVVAAAGLLLAGDWLAQAVLGLGFVLSATPLVAGLVWLACTARPASQPG